MAGGGVDARGGEQNGADAEFAVGGVGGGFRGDGAVAELGEFRGGEVVVCADLGDDGVVVAVEDGGSWGCHFVVSGDW